MSVNYYFATNNRELVKDMDCLLVDHPVYGYEIHVCKLTDGWRPIFEAHDGIDNFADYKRLMSRPDVVIYDDSYRTYSWDRFAHIVASAQKSGKQSIVNVAKLDARGFEDDFYVDPDGYDFSTCDFD